MSGGLFQPSGFRAGNAGGVGRLKLFGPAVSRDFQTGGWAQ